MGQDTVEGRTKSDDARAPCDQRILADPESGAGKQAEIGIAILWRDFNGDAPTDEAKQASGIVSGPIDAVVSLVLPDDTTA